MSARALVSRLAGAARAIVGGSSRHDADLRAELESHVAIETEEYIRRGVLPNEARRLAMLHAGGLAIAEESVRARRGVPVLEEIATDIRYGVRGLLHARGFTTAVVLTLALGIGANAAMFTIVDAVVLRPLPYPQSDRILSLSAKFKDVDAGSLYDADYFAWQQSARTVRLAAYTSERGVFATNANAPEQIRGLDVTQEYFSVFGVHPMLGRDFTAAETATRGTHVVILGEQLWRDRFRGDSSIIGRTVDIDGEPNTVVAVMPASFSDGDARYWRPYPIKLGTNGASFFFQTIARLGSGVPLATARAELGAISSRVDAARPVTQRGVIPVVMTLHDRRFGNLRMPLLVLFGAVGVLLLIACANVASLALARSSARRHEVAVRLALGAGRWRVMRAIAFESIMLSLAGGALGIALARAAVAYVIRLSPASVGDAADVHVGGVVVAFTFLVALAVGIAFAAAPAIASARGDLNALLASHGSRTTATRRRARNRRVLVVAQLATALVLLSGAGLVARTFWRVTSIDPGFRTANLQTVSVQLPRNASTDAQVEVFFNGLIAQVRALPGVTSAALADVPPLGGLRMVMSAHDKDGHEGPRIDNLDVGPEYMRTIGATLRAGREFTAADRDGAPLVMIMNETCARLLIPTGDPVGQTVTFAGQPRRIVGVVRDVFQRELEADASPVAYLPLAQGGLSPYERLLIRIDGPADPVDRAISGIVHELSGALAPPTYTMMMATVDQSIAPRRFTLLLMGSFAVVAALLAAIGLYGVLAQLVGERTREIGIRVALGADARRVQRMVLGEGMLLAAAGAGIGVIAALLSARVVRSLLFQTSVHDPVSITVVTVLLLAVSATASWIPARRASRVDAVLALRAD